MNHGRRTRRPRVICHMAASIDGRILVDHWVESVRAAIRREYEGVHDSYNADGWMCGRVTMEPFAKGVRPESEILREYTGNDAREDFVAPGTHSAFAFAIDASGRLAWEVNDISGDHVVAILSQRVSDDYLALLRERGVSFLLAGERDVDLSLALEKIGERFGVQTLMLEGGGKINGAFLEDGLIDEVSVVVAPTIDGQIGSATLFDGDAEKAIARPLALVDVERRAGDVLWLRYRVE